MEALLECFFENFSQLERNALHARYKRRAMIEYFNTLIEGCSRAEECDPQKTCREAIISILRYHEKTRQENGNVCVMGKCHNVLYVAVKLCFDWQLKDTATVAALLDQIYACEKSFERIWVGALFGIRAPYFVAGWKSDFENQEENLRAVVYFLDHATTAALEYLSDDGKFVRFIDIPLECCGKTTPLKIILQLGLPDKLHILLRFGAQYDSDLLESLLTDLSLNNGKYPYNLVDCLQFLLRALPSIDLEQSGENKLLSEESNLVCKRFPNLVEDGIIPITRCGIYAPSLKHLCRCAIRQRLWENYQLPNGIWSLPVPVTLKKYVDLLMD